jgi:predicted Zn-dependent protease
MKRVALLLAFLALVSAPAMAQVQRAVPGDTDQTLRAMRDEMDRSRERLRLGDLERPYYIEYRLLDLDVRTVVASFGALVSSTSSRNRYMAVDARVGDYRIDSSNFISDDAFRGFIGSTGQVGIDRDYDSLRQDLWLATDQAYKSALDSVSRKRGFLRSLSRPPDIPDFSREQPIVLVSQRLEPDWTSRNWDDEAKAASAALRAFPQLHGARITYHLIYVTYYMLNSEGSQIRVSRSLAAIEAAVDSPTDDGMPMHHFFTAYAARPADLPDSAAVRKDLDRTGRELLALRESDPAPDYVGPVLFESQASGALLAQMLGPSLSGARPPLSNVTMFDQIMERLGGRSEWVGRMNTRVLPAGVTLVDDPLRKEFNGRPLLGGYEVDEEGVPAQRVTVVENGILRQLLMSRRPGPDFQRSNGHGRAGFLAEARPLISNLIFEASDTQNPEQLRKSFLDMCRAAGREWCVAVKRMDNPALGFTRQEDFSDLIASVAGAPGDRQPLLVYRVYVNDGREELLRGARLIGMNLRALRNLAGIGNDSSVFAFFQNAVPGFAGTALGAFGTAQSGVPASVVAPSLLFEEVEVRGARGEPRRPPLVPAPPLN